MKHSRVEEIHLRLPPPHQPLKDVATGIHVLLHLHRGAREIVGVERLCDVGQISAAEVEGEADQSVELVLVDLREIR